MSQSMAGRKRWMLFCKTEETFNIAEKNELFVFVLKVLQLFFQIYKTKKTEIMYKN